MARLTLIITGKKKKNTQHFNECVDFVVFSEVIKYLKL